VEFHFPVYVRGRVHLHKDADDAVTEFSEHDVFDVAKALEKAAKEEGFWLTVDLDTAEQVDVSESSCDCWF
jgi:hypothetical protein